MATLEWNRGNLSDEDTEAVSKAYRKHLARLFPDLPPDVQRIASEIDLHDALIRQVVSNPQQGMLVVGLRCGDQQVGYFDLDLHYDEAIVLPQQWENLTSLEIDPPSEALYDEIDTEGDWFIHRILFIRLRNVYPPRHTYHEVEIRFKQLHVVTTPCGSRYAASTSDMV